jgi:Icc-related predicted phosphoesterase
MRVAALADQHGHLPETPACDVLVLAGDLTPAHDHDPQFQAGWLDTTFRAWLETRPAGEIVAIAGNHDFVFEVAPVLVPDLPWTYLEDSGCEIGGTVFWGSPWTPWFFDWAFNAPRVDEAETFLTERYARAPAAVDVLVLHGPPAGYGDTTAAGRSVGSSAALDLVRRTAPAVTVYGHIHEGRGAWELGPTRLANVAAVDTEYALYDDPVVVFDL